MKLNLQANLVGAVAHLKATNDIRYYLNGVYIEPVPAGVVVVATNGHAMAIWLDRSGEADRPAILRIDQKTRSALKGPKTNRLQLIDGRLVVSDLHGNELAAQPKNNSKAPDWEVSGKYPSWTRVLQQATGATKLMSIFSVEYLAEMRKVIRDGSREKFVSLRMSQPEPHLAITILSDENPDFIGVIMPMRDYSSGEPKIQSWVKSALSRDQRENEARQAPLPVYEPSDAGPPDGDGRGWALVSAQSVGER